MGLKLNDQKVRQPYEEFYGAIVKQMPLLIADNRVPMNTAQIMERRLKAGEESVGTWSDNYFGLGDAFAYKGDMVKIGLDAPVLRELTPKSSLSGGALVVSDKDYKAIEGPEFSRNELNAVLNRDLSADEAKNHPMLRALARDQGLLNEYVDRMFEEMKDRFGYDTAMGIYLPNQSNTPNVKALFVLRLENSRSFFGGASDLDCWYGRLVGVAPEALSAPGKAIQRPSLEASLRVVNDTLRNAGYEITAFPRK
ncbi:hypothetical protein AUJ64_00395 [Candidatus Pacearchaeota archaeon CG1_02_39_14]|nr:MAG: hypothetical protein AUJ64_00395 [Candidatus Pacearchaeota archaeon CG1_02_39_14]